MKTIACPKLTPVTLALAAAGLVTTAAHAQLQSAGALLMDLDATTLLPAGSLASITNNGTLGGFFEARGGGTTVPMVALVDGGGTRGIRLDGGDYLQHVASLGGPVVPANAGLVGVNPTCTIEAWVLNGAIDQEENIVAWGKRGGNPDGSNVSFNFGWDAAWGAVGHWGSSDMGWTSGADGGGVFGASVPSAGAWHHLVYTFDGATQRVYADGVMRNSESVSLNVFPGSPVTIGAQIEADSVTVTPGLRGSMTIGRLRIHDGVLSDAQVTANYNFEVSSFTNGPGALLVSVPIHRYEFNNAAGNAPSGAMIPDSIGTAHGTVLQSGALFNGNKLTLPGGAGATAAYVDLPDSLLSANSTNNGGSGEFTIEGWVRITGNRTWSRIFDFGSASGAEGRDYLMYTAQINTGVYTRLCGVRNVDAIGGTGGGGEIVHGTTTFNQDGHFAITWNDHTGEITAYENGALVTRRTETARIGQINDPNVWLGRSNYSGDQNAQGEFDEVRIYNRVLSEAELRGNFLRGPNLVASEQLAIVSQPQSRTVEASSNVTFSVAASGSSLGYQWRFNGADITGATATDYSISNAQLSNAGSYTVVVTNSLSSVTSAVAVLTVRVSEFTWDGGGDPNPNFSMGANWVGDSAPPNPARLNFDGNVNLNPQNDLAILNGLSNSIIHFNPGAGAFTLSGSPIRGGNVTNNSSVAQTINLPLRLDGGRTIDTGSGGIILGVPGTSTGSAQTWTKTGSGALTLRGNAGGTNVNYTINAGLMIFDTASGQTTRLSSASITLASGTQLRFQNAGAVALGSVNATAGSQIVLAHTGNITTSASANVNSGATIMGNGFYHTATVSGQLAPGASIGSLTFSNLTLNASANAVMELNRTNTPNADKFAVLGPFTLGSGGVALTVTNVGEPLIAGNTFDLYDASTFALSGGSPGYFSAAKMTLPLLAPGLEWSPAKLNSEGIIAVEESPANPFTNFARLKSLGQPERSGTNSYSHLIEGSDGALYGTTSAGFGSGGTVFKVNKDGSGYTGLHAFGTVANDGMRPLAGLIEGSDGALYGTTENGGTNGLGAVFKLNKDGSGYVVLKSFTGDDGQRPQAALLEGSDGVLYGTAMRAQFVSANDGTVFKLNKDGSGFTVLHTFLVGNGDGSSPYGALIEGADGALYGTTERGGSSTRGTVFKLNKDGSGYQIIKHFTGVAGDRPNAPKGALVEGTDGVLYRTTAGSTAIGSGSVFRLEKNGSGYAVLKDFASADGSELYAPLIQGSDGALYGTAAFGGTGGGGTIFRILTNGNEFAVLKNFSGPDGRRPYSALLQSSNGSLYGATVSGGANITPFSAGGGTLFTLNTNGTGHAILLPFGKDFTESQQPDKLIVGTDGMLYGTTLGNTSSGDTNNLGAVFKLNTDGSGFAVLHSFVYTNGDGQKSPISLIEATNGFLYGTTSAGGTSNRGALFKLAPDGSNYTILRSFTGRTGGNDGEYPASLIEGTDGVLYGAAAIGGISNRGTIFRLNADGSAYATLRHFSGTSIEGGFPNTLIEGDDGALYGTTAAYFSFVGDAGFGTVFRLNKDGSGYSVLRLFVDTPDGYNPAGLIEGSDGVLYGATQGGGMRNEGTLFKLNKDGTGYAKLFNFVADDFGGGGPQAGVVEGADGALYGTTPSGRGFAGLAFRINKSGSGFRVLKRFAYGSSEGAAPMAELVRGTDGALYGTASDGGDLILGTIFKLFSTPASPMITAQPQSRTNTFGSGATFSVTALGAQPLSYQWQLNETDITGAMGTEYAISSVDITNAGNYRVIIANSLGSVTSAVATLTVMANNPPIVANPIPDQTNTYGAAFDFTFAANAFTDADAGQVLSYNAGALPPGINFTSTTRTFSGTNVSVATYSVTVTATDNGAPTMSTNDTFTFIVEKVPLTATASDTNRVYGELNPAFTGGVSGLVNSDDINATFSSTAATNSPPGNYPITPVFADPDNKLGNYNVTTNVGVLTVAAAPLTVTAGDTNRVYGAPNPSFTGMLMGIVNDDNIKATFLTAATIADPPGLYPITPVLNDPDGKLGNYAVTTNNGILTIISPPELSITTGGGDLITLSWPASYSGFVLELTENLTPPIDWQPVTSGITESGGIKSYLVTNDRNVPGRLYRLRLP